MSVVLLVGDDPVLLGERLGSCVDELLAGADRSLALEELDESSYRTEGGEWDLTPLLVAARTPPLLTGRRVVVARHLGRFPRADAVRPLVDALSDLLDTTDLVLVWERGAEPRQDRLPAPPKALVRAVESGGRVERVDAPTRARDGEAWIRDQLASSGLRFDTAATRAVVDLVGQDRSRVVGLVRTLVGALGEGARVTQADVATYGGGAGDVAPWELDDAIDRGDVAGAVEVLHRQLGSRHPFQVLAALAARYGRLLRLDGVTVRDEAEAAELLGVKGFPARKLAAAARTLGHDGILRAVRLVARADLDLRGASAVPPEQVLEILVARLAALSRRRR